MKPSTYLAFPLAATLLNVLLALAFLKYSKAHEIPAIQESVRVFDVCADEEGSDKVCGSPLDHLHHHSWSVESSRTFEGEEEVDPALKQMPTVDFAAYVRPDISSFYQEEPGSRQEKTPAFRGQAGKFINFSPRRLSLYWDSGVAGQPGRFISYAGPFESTGTATFPGHRFYFAHSGKPDEPICYFNVVKGTSVYYFDPYSEDQNEPARCTPAADSIAERRSLDELDANDREIYDALVFNLEFADLYRNFTGGSEWLSMYPRSPPVHKIWRADYFGQEHEVETRETQFVSLPPESELPKLSTASLRRNDTDEVLLQDYRISQPSMKFTLKTVSCAPRAFEISHFLSDLECDHILDLAQKKNLHLSTTGNPGSAKADSDTRTSTNTWVSRYSSPITDSIYRRVADVLRMDEALLRHRSPDEHADLGTSEPLSEDLQLVHYDPGQQYTAHHDFSYPDNHTPNSPSRSINVLLYLNDEGLEGGETSFPKARSAETTGSFDVKPVKGKAVIFYMLLPDGNLDDLTQHAALPVKKGEKWLANLWIHDPVK